MQPARALRPFLNTGWDKPVFMTDDDDLFDQDRHARLPDALRVLDAMEELVLVRDEGGRIVCVNEMFRTAFGGEVSDWVGRWFAVAPALGQNGQARRYDVAMQTRDGPIWVEWSESRLGDEGLSLAVGRNVTEERQARERESVAAKGKSVFFAAVTHELRTPLSGALGAAALLEETELAPDQRAYLSAVRESAGHSLQLIDDILDLTRLEAGRLDLNPTPIDIRALLEQAGEVLAPRALERGLSFAHAVDGDVPETFEVDASRFKQILFNLAGNAVKFTHSGGVLISLSYEAQLLCLSVKDTGPGIAKSDQVRLFQHFERGQAERARAPGAGLGLAMVKRLTEAMGGEVGVHSELGEGASFWARLPLPALSAAPTEKPLLGRAVILAAADRVQREALARQARALGADAVDAGAPDAALELARSKDAGCDVTVILDAGWADAAPQVKRLVPGSRVLALAEPRTKHRFTGNDCPDGVDGWLVAPVRLASLAAWAAGREVPSEDTTREKVSLGTPFTDLSILLAEDDPVNAMIARTILTRLGADVTHVEDGRCAVETALTASFDAALLDLRMPELSGLEVAEAIRRAPSGRGLPLVALTANATEADRTACLAAGMDEFLTKPLQPQALVDVLTALCAPQKRANVG